MCDTACRNDGVVNQPYEDLIDRTEYILSELFVTKFPSCDCGRLKGEDNRDNTCEVCNTVCRNINYRELFNPGSEEDIFDVADIVYDVEEEEYPDWLEEECGPWPAPIPRPDLHNPLEATLENREYSYLIRRLNYLNKMVGVSAAALAGFDEGDDEAVLSFTSELRDMQSNYDEQTMSRGPEFDPGTVEPVNILRFMHPQLVFEDNGTRTQDEEYYRPDIYYD